MATPNRRDTDPVARTDPQVVRTGVDRSLAPHLQPRNVQPSNKPGQVMGRQGMTGQPTVRTGPVAGSGISGLSVSQRAARIAGGDSALMRQAATRGKQYAASRGLLNSSIAAGAMQGAVLDRAHALARDDADVELKNFYASLDMTKFERDDAYRNRALAQEKTLQDARRALDRELGTGALDVSRERLGLDRELGTARLGLDRNRLALEGELGRGRLALEGELGRGRLSLDTELGRRRLTLDEEIGHGRLDLDRELGRGRLQFDREKFDRDLDYRYDVLQQQWELEQQRLDLDRDEQQFRQGFDRQRFNSDEDYRRDALGQAKELDNRRIDLELSRLGFQRDQFTHNAWAALRSHQGALWTTYQQTVATIMGNPELTDDQRQKALDKAEADYVTASRDAQNLSRSPITFDGNGRPGDDDGDDGGGAGEGPRDDGGGGEGEQQRQPTSTRTAENGDRIDTYDDGTVVRTEAGGDVVTRRPDGTVTRVKTDGTLVYRAADGTVSTVRPDGSWTSRRPDGTTTSGTIPNYQGPNLGNLPF